MHQVLTDAAQSFATRGFRRHGRHHGKLSISQQKSWSLSSSQQLCGVANGLIMKAPQVLLPRWKLYIAANKANTFYMVKLTVRVRVRVNSGCNATKFNSFNRIRHVLLDFDSCIFKL